MSVLVNENACRNYDVAGRCTPHSHSIIYGCDTALNFLDKKFPI